jgi:serine/threonine protein kinase/WD40 repeat protein
MPAPKTIDQFLELGRKSGVLDQPVLDTYFERLRADAGVPGKPRGLAKLMVRDGLLTDFQADQLLRGKWKGFTIAGKYRLIERLGSGGMGSVFLCEHQYMKRRVAIKFLPTARVAEPGCLDRFYREARAVATLDHLNIVRAHDIDHDGDLHFLVMEYVDGSSLLDIVKQHGAMDIIRAAHYVRQAAEGLQHAHEAGVVHRDIKPGNMLLDRGGTIKILDMGLALFFNEEQDNLTRQHDSKSVLGTADYLAPEQALNSHNVDIRADIYSLGVTFYVLLSGEAPFSGGSVAQKLICHQMVTPKPIQSVRPEVPEEIAAIIAKMIAKEPADRYQSPIEVVEALLPWTSASIPPPPEAEMPQLCTAARKSGHSDATLLLPGSSGAGLATPVPRKQPTLVDSRSSGASRPRSSSEITAQNPGVVPAAAVVLPRPPSRLSNYFPASWRENAWRNVLVIAGMIFGAAFLISGGTFLLRLALAEPAPKVSNFTIAEFGSERALPAAPARSDSERPAPAGKVSKLASELMPGEYLRLDGHTGVVEGVAYSPDGRTIVTCGMDKTVRLWNAETGSEIRRFEGHTATVYTAVFSRDGQRVLTASSDKTVRLWDLPTGLEVRRFTGHNAVVSAAVFSADGTRILSGGDDKMLRLWDAGSGQELQRFAGHTQGIWFVLFSPDGKQALSCGKDATVRLWDVATGEELRQFTGHTAPVRRAAFLPDGKRVLSGSFDMTMRLWDVDTGNLLHTYDARPFIVEGIAVTADGHYALTSEGPDNRDGKMLVTTDHGIRLWDLAKGEVVYRLGGVASKVLQIQFAPDYRYAVSASFDGCVRQWRLPPLSTTGAASGAAP